jgi:hypothetical protein
MPFGVSSSENSGPQRFTEQGSEAPSSAGYKPPRGGIQRSSSIVVLRTNTETRPSDFHHETWEGPVTTLVVSAYYSARHDWHTVRKCHT